MLLLNNLTITQEPLKFAGHLHDGKITNKLRYK